MVELSAILGAKENVIGEDTIAAEMWFPTAIASNSK
jgi:hypothetical protein